jgi:cytochrome c553
VKKTVIKSSPLALLAAMILVASAAPAFAEDAAADKKAFDVKSNFRNVCGFCHEDYGRHTGKGPQLMGSERTDQQLFDRIKKGLPGRMAAFGSVYSDEQIGLIVKFIRNLKPGEEPQNP